MDQKVVSSPLNWCKAPIKNLPASFAGEKKKQAVSKIYMEMQKT